MEEHNVEPRQVAETVDFCAMLALSTALASPLLSVKIVPGVIVPWSGVGPLAETTS